jgi:PAS domain S-box-containing protein
VPVPSVDALLSTLVATSVDGILGFDRDLRYTLWSPGMERISGVSATDVLGKRAFDVFPFLVETGEESAFHRALAGDSVTTSRRRFDARPAGQSGYFDGHYRPVRDADGNVVAGLAVIRDVTALVEHDLVAQRMTLAVEAARLGPWEWAVDTDLVTLTGPAAEIFGVEPGPQMTWEQVRGLLHPDDRERTRAAVEAAVRGRTDYEMEYRVLRPQGEEVWVAAHGRALYDGAGRPLRMLGMVKDITERKRAEQALIEENRAIDAIQRVGKALAGELDLERLLQVLTDAATEISDARFGSFFYNVVDDVGPSYMLYTLSGASREDFAGFPMPRATAVFAPTFRGDGIVRSDDITRDPRYGHSEPYRGMPAGHLPVRSYLAVPVVSRSGEVLGGLFFGHERTGVFTARHERILSGIASQAAVAIDNARLYQKARLAEQQARDHVAELALADRRKDDFLAMLGHELRNPLGALSNAIQVVAQTRPDDPMFRRAVEIATRQIGQQSKLVDDLLDVSRVTRGKIALVREPVDLARLVDHAVEDHRAAIAAAGLSLEVSLPAEPALVVVDRVRITQAIGNLLDNARKFTHRGGRVGVRLEIADREARVVVADTGIGLDPAMLSQLFTPFAQGGRGLDRSQGGLGLGLSLVKGLVELQGGHVEAHSAGPDRGAEFRLVLSVADQAVEPAIATPRARGAGRHVLIVEDLADAAETLRDVLVLIGCTVDLAADAVEALARIDARRPDLVLCDLGLPGAMDGLGLARELRARHGAELRLVAMTGYGSDADKDATRAAGFDAHLTKPLQMKHIVDVIDDLPPPA